MRAFIKRQLGKSGISLKRFAKSRDIMALVGKMHPVRTQFELIRLGAAGDGGYLVPDDLEGIVACFSPGVDFVAKFEKDLVDKGIPCFLADASVDSSPLSHDLIRFDKKYVGVSRDKETLVFDEWVTSLAPPGGDLILQMDIEGGEWPILLNTSNDVLSRFRIIVLELHYMDDLMEKSSFPIISAALSRVLNQFYVVHLHPNNCARPSRVNSLDVMPLLEVTLLRKDRANIAGYERNFPHPLDSPCVAERKDVVLPRGWSAVI